MSLHPGLLPYATLLAELQTSVVMTDRDIGLRDAGGWIAQANLIAERRNIRSAGGAPLRFEGDESNGMIGAGALDYEAAIHDEGRVACRTRGRGAVHDLHNALVWLRFPRLKAELNRLHRRSIPESTSSGTGVLRRGSLRDAVTLLDESGFVWLSADPDLDTLLASRQWDELLWHKRERVRRAVHPVIFGHGLLEKLHRPYKAMTGHGFACQPSAGDDTDAAITAHVARLAAGDALTPANLLALPVQGLPGWDPANLDPSYYADRQVFRPLPSRPPRQEPARQEGD